MFLYLIAIGLIMFGFGGGWMTANQKYAFRGIIIFALGIILILIGLLIGVEDV